MKKLKKKLRVLKYIIFNCFFIILYSSISFADQISFEIKGNNYTDSDVIISLLKNIPQRVDEEFSNEIIKTLNKSNLFSDVSVKFSDNKYTIIVKEFPNIDNLYFTNNERLNDEDLELIALESDLKNFNVSSINKFIKEIKKMYEAFGYNNVLINYNEKINIENNTVDLYFNIDEGKITKINQIIITGNDMIASQDIKEVIKSKTKSFRNIFANNNYKPIIAQSDIYNISNYYKNRGYLEVKVDYKVEFLKTNRVNIYFNIIEGNIYYISSIKIKDDKSILNSNILNSINLEINNFVQNNKNFSLKEIKELRKKVSSIIFEAGVNFFEINTFDKVENNKVDIIFQILPIKPVYTNQIKIFGNTRTYDYVIRRELDIIEGDAIYKNQIQNIRDKLVSLKLFETVNVTEQKIEDESINIIIEVEEKQTGSFNAGVSVGTLDGFSIVTGLKERNFYGTGRSLDLLLNTSKDKNEFKVLTTDRLSYENDADISYKLNYKQQDFSKSSSYKLDTFSTGTGIGYKLNKNLYHNIDLEYVLKDYKITDSSTASNSILNSSGGNVSILLKNNLRYSTLNSGFIPKNGNFINFNNSIETPTSSSNGFIRNIITFKKYYSNNNNNIFSFQTKLGNIFSLNDKDILTDNKFALGGRWLRGFDNYGAGPRNSRTSYVGGNNIAVTKFDYSYEINNNQNFPIFLNFFNDYGMIWDNKTKPTQTDNSLRASAGFGIKYYSPIGPIGFSWGFPLMDKEYDIKRMFLFSVGNID